MQFKTGNIKLWLENLPDINLAALRAHAEDGRLSFSSCSCLVGSRTAPHALGTAGEYCDQDSAHLEVARSMPYGLNAEAEFDALGNPGDGLSPSSDALRIERLMPLILAEQDRRAQSTTGILDSAEVAEVV